MVRSVLTLLLMACATMAQGRQVQQCVDYGDYLRRVGNAPTLGSARSIVVAGDVGFLADGDAGLTVLDLTDPAQPVPLAGLDSVGTALWIAYHDGHVYLADNSAQLHVVDVGEPARPRHLLSLPLPGSAHAFALRPPLMLLAAGHAGLMVLDVGTPAQPIVLGLADTPGIARGVDVVGNLVVVADQDALRTYDISSPQQPAFLASVPALGQAYGVDLDGDTAVVAGWQSGLEVYDLSDPAAPYPIALLPLPGSARYVERTGDLIFVAAGVLCAVDLSTRHLPRLVGKAEASDGPISVTTAGPLALVPAGDGGLDVFDADPPTSPPVYSITGVDGAAFGVDTRGNLTALGADHLQLFDHSDPTQPVLLGTLPFAGSTSRLAFADDVVVLTVAGAMGRVLVVDVSDPTEPVIAAAPELDGFVSQLAVDGSLVYLADFFYGGLFVLDIADPTRPTLEDTEPSRPFAQHLSLAQGYLLVGTGGFAAPVIQVFDLADPRRPELADELFPAGEAVNGLAASAGHVFATVQQGYGASELQVYEAGDPAAMQLVGSLALPHELHEVEVAEGTAYVCSYEGVIHAIDVSDPTAPRPIGQTYLPDSAFVLALGDQTLHAAATDVGLALLPRHCIAPVAAPDQAAPTLPAGVAISVRAHPNPFNPAVSLDFSLERGADTSLTIYDVAGRRVIELVRGPLAAGAHTATWDGRHDSGRAMPSGVYLARLVSGGRVGSSRLLLAR
jgi:hypothetical protein